MSFVDILDGVVSSSPHFWCSTSTLIHKGSECFGYDSVLDIYIYISLVHTAPGGNTMGAD